MNRSFSVEPCGKKFATVCRTDGYWSITWLSKNRRLAVRKGEEFLAGKRTSMRKYVTAYGQALNTQRSLAPRDIPALEVAQ